MTMDRAQNPLLPEPAGPRSTGIRVFVCALVISWMALSVAIAQAPDTSDRSAAGDSTFPLTFDASDTAMDALIIGDSVLAGTGPWEPRPMVNYAFGVAETLWYDVGWQSIVAGNGVMYVGEPVDTNGRLCYPIFSTVKSTPFFSAFFRVDDSAASFMDVRELFPLRFEKYLREGKYRTDRVADFDPVHGLAYTPGDTIVVPPYVQDALSLLYYVRALELEPGNDITVENYSGSEVYNLKVRILRRERIKVKGGTFSTIVVEPLLQAAGLFKHEGRLTVWLTDDRLHLPVLMKSKVIVGSIVAELTDYRLGRIRRY